MKLIKRDPCKDCIYFIAENNTCQSKKCCTGDGRIGFLEKLFCSPYTKEMLANDNSYYDDNENTGDVQDG